MKSQKEKLLAHRVCPYPNERDLQTLSNDCMHQCTHLKFFLDRYEETDIPSFLSNATIRKSCCPFERSSNVKFPAKKAASFQLREYPDQMVDTPKK